MNRPTGCALVERVFQRPARKSATTRTSNSSDRFQTVSRIPCRRTYTSSAASFIAAVSIVGLQVNRIANTMDGVLRVRGGCPGKADRHRRGERHGKCRLSALPESTCSLGVEVEAWSGRGAASPASSAWSAASHSATCRECFSIAAIANRSPPGLPSKATTSRRWAPFASTPQCHTR